MDQQTLGRGRLLLIGGFSWPFVLGTIVWLVSLANNTMFFMPDDWWYAFLVLSCVCVGPISMGFLAISHTSTLMSPLIIAASWSASAVTILAAVIFIHLLWVISSVVAQVFIEPDPMLRLL